VFAFKELVYIKSILTDHELEYFLQYRLDSACSLFYHAETVLSIVLADGCVKLVDTRVGLGSIRSIAVVQHSRDLPDADTSRVLPFLKVILLHIVVTERVHVLDEKMSQLHALLCLLQRVYMLVKLREKSAELHSDLALKLHPLHPLSDGLI
jgi:hypothetical protein